ncbi:Membrane attack complex component/perforin (MACPF) domain-containing protein [Cynara cardunculus var. scolymus]|uniref:Membrane attack complex component/perforin (MACPF) domain-containing protein n=1 Tax=Cynara cardunculus var. scolymus TaxID=59895 RepID=A0A103XHU1_CYNCS|nr:Membrane attack complex component/perforin (MACPF) domain-containing protein [Cynara cardunculus var. scolymus]
MDYSNKPIELMALDYLGLGFDVASDFRLKFAKRCPDGGRLVELNESRKRDIVLPGGGATISGVSEDIRCDKGDRIRFKSDVLEFNKMSELLNQKSSIQGKVPSGYFNALFDLSGAWLNDVAEAKYLAFDGYFISLYYLHLTATPPVLQERVKKSVPTYWNPLLLARFIQTYGTHIIVGMAVGGQDLICVKQKASSTISSAELRGYLDDLGDSLFSDGRSPSLIERKTRDGKQKGLTVIECKRGGDVFSDSHSKWLQTVGSNPEAMLFKQACSRRLAMFLRVSSSETMGTFILRATSEASKKKDYVPSASVLSDDKPVTGLRLFLEGKKCNRLAMHVQHLSSLPDTMTETPPNSTISRRPPRWRGTDEYDSSAQFLEPIRWNRYSNVCSSVVEHDPNWLHGEPPGGVFIATGAQLLSKGKWPKTILHLRLLFTYIPNCTIHKAEWGGAPAVAHKSSLFTNLSSTFTFTQRSVANEGKQLPTTLNSGVFPDSPPVPVRYMKLHKFVDTDEVVRGPHDSPGHWLVMGGRLVTDGGKIGLHVKFALLDFA